MASAFLTLFLPIEVSFAVEIVFPFSLTSFGRRRQEEQLFKGELFSGAPRLKIADYIHPVS